MIECDVCGKDCNPDDIQHCPECGYNLCSNCYDKHVKKCLNENNWGNSQISELE